MTIGVICHDHTCRKIYKENIKRIDSSDDLVKAPVIFQNVIGKLCKARHQCENAGENMNVKGRSPNFNMKVVLFLL